MPVYDGIKMYPVNGHNAPVLDKVRLVLRSSTGTTRGYVKRPYNQRFRAEYPSQKVSK